MAFTKLGEKLNQRVSQFDTMVTPDPENCHNICRDTFLEKLNGYSKDPFTRAGICFYANDRATETDEDTMTEILSLHYLIKTGNEEIKNIDKMFLVNAYIEYTLVKFYCHALLLGNQKEIDVLKDLVVDKLNHSFKKEDGSIMDVPFGRENNIIQYADFLIHLLTDVANTAEINLDVETEAQQGLEKYLKYNVGEENYETVVLALKVINDQINNEDNNMENVKLNEEVKSEKVENTQAEVAETPKKKSTWKKLAIGAGIVVLGAVGAYALMHKKDDTNIVFE